MLGWEIADVAKECQVSECTIFRIQANLLRYGSVRKPQYRKLGRARKLSLADEDTLFEYLLGNGWSHQDEMIYWLFNERGVMVSQPTISRLLKRRGWSRKEMRRISLNRSEELRRSYIEDIRRFTLTTWCF